MSGGSAEGPERMADIARAITARVGHVHTGSLLAAGTNAPQCRRRGGIRAGGTAPHPGAGIVCRELPDAAVLLRHHAQYLVQRLHPWDGRDPPLRAGPSV